MALSAATAGGDWLTTDEWLALGREQAAVLFKVHAHLPEKQMDNGPVFPVECDLLILSGDRAGELHTGQQPIGKGLTTPLRRVRPGNELVGVMGIGTRKGSRVEYAQVNPPTPEQFAKAQALFADGRDPFREAARAANGTQLEAAGEAPEFASAASRPF